LQLILRGKAVNLSLAEIREILDLYDKNDGGATQNATALRKFRERIVVLERQREDLDHAIAELQRACANLEESLSQSRPDLLSQTAPQAAAPTRVGVRQPEAVR
jgi:DNA-binding transcriptional MerR regulator